jgi:ribose transport system ATP-binding protein
MIEIAKAVSKDAKILIMDEPTAALSENETTLLFDFIDKLKEKNVSIIYISHRMEEIFKITDRITILRNGKKITTVKTSQIDMDKLIEYIVGKNLEEKFEWKPRKNSFKKDKPVLEVKNFSSFKSNLNDVNFKLFKGEILGVAGLMGSGRSEMVETIFGLDDKKTGQILLDGKEISIKNAEDAMDKGFALIPEDRREEGLILDHSVKENILLTVFDETKSRLLINNNIGKDITNNYIDKLNIVTDSMHKKVSLLSGGNQQKVVLAKWLATEPRIYLLDEPTIGVDIGAKTEIMEIIREIANSGKSVLVISSELRELMAVSDRILIMSEGKVVDSFERSEIRSEEDLQHAIQN